MPNAALSAISDDYQFRLHSTSYFSPAAAHEHVDLAAHAEFGHIHTRFDGKAAIRQNAAFVADLEVVDVGAVGMHFGANRMPGAMYEVLPVAGLGDALTNGMIHLPAADLLTGSNGLLHEPNSRVAAFP